MGNPDKPYLGITPDRLLASFLKLHRELPTIAQTPDQINWAIVLRIIQDELLHPTITITEAEIKEIKRIISTGSQS